MANSGRNLGWVLFAVVFCSIVIFLGCGGGGGGNSDDPIVGYGLSYGNITGTLSSSGNIANVKSSVSGAIMPDINFALTTLYLEERPDFRVTPSASGTFLFSKVPFGTYHIVASMTSTGGLVYKVRTAIPVSVVQSAPTTSTQVTVTPSGLANSYVQIEVRNASGTPVDTATVVVWGERFASLGGGVYRSPLMPVTVATVTVTPPAGYQPSTIPTVNFTSSSTPTITATVIPTGTTNRPPVVVSLTANPPSVSVNGTISLIASATDPDGDPLVATWAASAGTLTSTSNTAATWRAPTTATTATVYYTVTESGRTPAYSATASVNVAGTGYATDTPPVVTILSPFNGQSVAGNSVVTFTASSPGPLFSWTADSGTVESGADAAIMTWRAPTPAVGTTTTSRVVCTVTNGALTASAVVNLNIIGGPVAVISSPTATTFYPGVRTFAGYGTSGAGADIPTNNLRWYVTNPASVTSLMGLGKTPQYNFTTHGSYLIALVATDNVGQSATATKNITIINQPPTGTIASPTAGFVYPPGQAVTLKGSGNDLEDGTITTTNSLGWYTSNPTVTFIGSGTTVTFNSPAVGNHLITLVVRDSDGDIGYATVTMRVNSGPTMTMNTPASNSTFFAGNPVFFSGSGSDVESGAVPGASMTWYLNGAPWVNATSSFNAAQTAPFDANYTTGHLVTLTGTDADGQIGTVTKRIYSGVPNFTFTVPAQDGAGPRYNTTRSLSFVGTPNDSDRKFITSYWILNYGMATQSIVASGVSTLNTSSIASGWHTLTWVGTDSSGIVSSFSTQFWINQLPVATLTIASPTQYATGPANTPIYVTNPLGEITLNASGFDYEAGNVPAASISWSFDGGLNFLSTGLTKTQPFAPGTNTVIIRVYDNFGFYTEVSKIFWVWEVEQYSALVASPLGITSDNNTGVFVTQPSTSEIFKLDRNLGPAEADRGDLTFNMAEGSASLSASLVDLTFDGTKVYSLEGNKKIQAFSSADLASAGPVLTVGTLGTPRAITYGNSSFWVADSNRVVRINPTTGAEQGSVSVGEPANGVAYHSAGHFYVTLNTSGVLRKYSSTFVQDVGFAGTGATGADRVTFGTNFIFVSDGLTPGHIHMFSMAGTKLTTFGLAAPGLGYFTAPKGMTVVNNEDLYIVESGTNRITRIRFAGW